MRILFSMVFAFLSEDSVARLVFVHVINGEGHGIGICASIGGSFGGEIHSFALLLGGGVMRYEG
jgi:hypothetical protein